MKKYLITLCVFLPFSLLGQGFQEISDQIGLTYIYPGISTDFQVEGGVLVFDYDRDGWDDIYQTSGQFESKLYKNMGNGTYTDVTAEAGLTLPGIFQLCALSGDFDNDGYTDLLIANYGYGGGGGDNEKPKLFRNNGNGTFSDMSFQLLVMPRGHYAAASLGDINRDGNVDMYFANYVEYFGLIQPPPDYIPTGYFAQCLPDRLVLNNGNFAFIEATEAWSVADSGCGLAASFSDYDNDGDLDIVTANDFGFYNGKGNILFRNNFPDSTVTDVSVSSGYYFEMFGMGVGPGDYDNDGDMDYYITNIGENALMQNQGNGTFINVAEAAGVKDEFVSDTLRGTGWSGIFFDYDNDMDLDLFVTKGSVGAPLPPTVGIDPNRFFINNGDGTFTESAALLGLNDSLAHRGAAFLDFDRDGDLDLVSLPIRLPYAQYANLDQKIKFFRNDLQNTNKWVQIKLVGDVATNRDALGCKVTLWAGGVQQIREVDGGSGHASQSSKTLHFGLGQNTLIDSMEVFWLNTAPAKFYNIQPDEFYTVFESGSILLSNKENLSTASQVQVFPNPSSGPVNITYPPSKQTHIRVLSLTGASLFEVNTDYSDWYVFNPDTYHLSPGVYFIEVSGTFGKSVKKWVKN